MLKSRPGQTDQVSTTFHCQWTSGVSRCSVGAETGYSQWKERALGYVSVRAGINWREKRWKKGRITSFNHLICKQKSI